MKFPLLKIAGILLTLLPSLVQAQDYYNQQRFRYDNFTYSDKIRTVQLFKAGDDQTPPIIELNSGESLELHFDEMDGTQRTYQYTFIHCDPNWEPSSLLQNQYLGGYMEDRITKFSYSLNAMQRYIHYSLQFPTRDMYPAISGNYVLKVYPEGDPDNVIITRRFMVVESQVVVVAQARKATRVDDRFQKQEIVFNIGYPNYNDIVNPVEEVRVVLMQNDRWDNAIFDLRPQFVRDRELLYQYDQGNVFDGGNEHRFFDLRTIKYMAGRVTALNFEEGRYHFYYQTDKPRYFEPYAVLPDIDGRFKIKLREELSNSNIEADYVAVHCSLVPDEKYENDKVYVLGQFNNYQPSDEYKLNYNEQTRLLEANLYLKQGYYDYTYATMKDGKIAASSAKIEGTYSDTENDYNILVYHKPISQRYYRLVAYKRINSIRF